MPEHAPRDVTEMSDAQATSDILRHYRHPSAAYWLAVVVLGILLAAGLVGFVIKVSAGFPNTEAWGYYAATFSFLLTTAMAAPIIPVGLHFTKALWQRPLNRAALLFAVPGILWGLMFLPLLWTLPPLQGRPTMWFNASIDVLRWVDTIAVFTLVALGLVLLYERSRPDWATIAFANNGQRHRLAKLLAKGWRGTTGQWDVLLKGFSLLGGFYLLLYAYVTMLITIDFDMSLVPGWRSPIYPTYHILTSMQAAVALTLIVATLLRGLGGWREYLGIGQFWAMGKLLLALTLLWFYFFWSEFIVIWYGRTPREITLLQIFEFGPYYPIFVLTVALCFVIPFVLLIWNRVRKSYVGPPIAGLSVLVGLFFDRIRLFVPAYSVAGTGGAAAGQVPAAHLPDLADGLIMIGALAGTAFLYLLAMRILPVMSIWEMKAYQMLHQVRKFLRAMVEVVAKPS